MQKNEEINSIIMQIDDVIDSKGQSANDMFGIRTFVDTDKFNDCIYKIKSFIFDMYGENSFYFKEFLKLEKPQFTGDTNYNIIKKVKSFFKAVESNVLSKELKTNSIKEINNEKVFIVHGHDELAIQSCARFIEKMKLEAIILKDEPSLNNTIIEKLEKNTDVGFGIILYTPCDLGAKNEEPLNLKERARQNVVFEHGYLIGKLGRDRVCVLVKGDTEYPNDISGTVYITFDESDSWKLELAQEFKTAGYNINLNDILH